MSREKVIGIRNKIKKEKSILNFIIFIFIFLFISAVLINYIYQKNIYNELVEVENQIIQQINEETEKNIKYKSEKDYYKSDAYIEKVAREQLGLIKSDELIIINRAE